VIRQLIHNEEARGNLAAASELEQALLALARRHPDDLRTVPILREAADKQMHVLERHLAGELPPQISLGVFYRPPHPRYQNLRRAVSLVKRPRSSCATI